MNQYELHPLCTLFPRLAQAELDALAGDIATNGLREPITLHGGLILDGGNRYQACLLAGVEPTFREFDGGNLVSFVLSANLHRRHLSAGQQSAIVSSAQDWAKAQTHGGARLGEQAAILPLDTVRGRAAQSGSSERTQRMADKVAKADPDLAREVAHGTKSLPQAVEELTGKRPGAKPTLKAAEVYENEGPSAEEIADAERSAREDEERVRLILDSDDAVAALTEKCKQQAAMIRALEGRIAGLTNQNAEHVRRIKSLNRQLDQLQKAAA